MLELPHTVVGAVIATKIGNPALALPLALTSHFVLDLVPHWNPHLNTELAKYGKVTWQTRTLVWIDVVVSLAVGLYISTLKLPDLSGVTIVVLGALMGVLPDLIESPHFFLGLRWKPIENLIKFQKSIQNDTGLVFGLATQVVILTATVWWLIN